MLNNTISLGLDNTREELPRPKMERRGKSNWKKRHRDLCRQLPDSNCELKLEDDAIPFFLIGGSQRIL